MKFLKIILPFLVIAIVLSLVIVFFLRIGNNNISLDNDGSLKDNNTGLGADESIQSNSAKLFEDIEVNIISYMDFDTYSYDIDISGQLAYVGRLGYMDIVNVSDKENPSVIKTIENGQGVNRAIAGDDHVYLLSDHKLNIMDNTDPANPDFISETGFEGFDPKAALNKDFLYISASGVSGSEEVSVFYILDISSKNNPEIIFSTDFPVPVYGFYYYDGFIYLTGSGVVYMIGLSSDSEPEIMTELEFDGWVNDIIIQDDIAFLAGNTGLEIWDFSDNKEPEIIDTIEIGGYGQKLFLYGNQLFIFTSSENDENNFLVVDISDDQINDFTGKVYNIPVEGYPQDLEIYDGKIFLLCNELINYETGKETAVAEEIKSRLYIFNTINNSN